MQATHQVSARAAIITRTKYNRPLNEEGTKFETWGQTTDRVMSHQRWLWERAQEGPLTADQTAELASLRTLMIDRKSMPAGRVLWLGGTELIRRRESAGFNCSFTDISTIHDAVDVFWLLLQGCGVGFRPVPGRLTGFSRKLELEVIRSTRTAKGGEEGNLEKYDAATRTWTVRIGDSAEAWAKSIGKILAHPYAAKKLVLDLSQLRPPGIRLRGYGWVSSGDENLSQAYAAIVAVLNRRAGRLLTKEDIWDIINWLGTVLSSRRSAQIGLIEDGDAETSTISARKYAGFDKGPDWYRGQSNNTIVFNEKPTARRLKHMFEQMAAQGGSEPGFFNMTSALKRAPWCRGVNPCCEVLLGGFCNLVETNVHAFQNDDRGLHDALALIGRANYRQTCVNLRDGILQSHWHEQNEYLRLCGVGICGVVQRPDLTAYDYRQMKYAAVYGAYSMADELGKERPKNTTTVKPGGTVAKCMDATEGIKHPDGRFILNRVNFRRDDPVLEKLLNAGYQIEDHPSVTDSCLAILPFEYSGVTFGMHKDGTPINTETAIDQLERYRFVMNHFCEQNASTTIMWDPSEIPQLVRWFDRYWDEVVGVSFCLRNDHTKTADMLGYAYLPQAVVDEATFRKYAAGISPVDLDDVGDLVSFDDAEVGNCDTGMCPAR